MIAGRFGARSLLAGCALGLMAVSVLGGVLIAAAEGVAYSKGLAVFRVITTFGFGDGPTSRGQLIAAGALVAAATWWFGIAPVLVEVGLSRFARDALERSSYGLSLAAAAPTWFTRTDGGVM